MLRVLKNLFELTSVTLYQVSALKNDRVASGSFTTTIAGQRSRVITLCARAQQALHCVYERSGQDKTQVHTSFLSLTALEKEILVGVCVAAYENGCSTGV